MLSVDLLKEYMWIIKNSRRNFITPFGDRVHLNETSFYVNPVKLWVYRTDNIRELI